MLPSKVTKRILAPARPSARQNKFMGDVEEVKALRLGMESPPSSGRGKKIATILGGTAAVGTGAAMMSSDKEKTSKEVSGKASPDKQETKISLAKEAPAKETSSKEKKAGLSNFGKAFKESRAAGLKTFEFDGKRYTTRLAEESSDDHSDAIKKIKEKNEAAYEKKIKELSDTKMAKGGLAKKQQAKVATVMKEWKDKSLHSGKGGKVVKDKKQAVAIALSQARKMKK